MGGPEQYSAIFKDPSIWEERFEKPFNVSDYNDRFILYFGEEINISDDGGTINTGETMQRVVMLTYFAFTTLSTVGFGDYHPRSDLERFFCAFILLFGVACFSLIMGTFQEILIEFQDFNKDINEGDMLRSFFGVL